MIVLDTNVLSEPLRVEPDANVLRWLGAIEDDVRITSITAGELLTGIGILPVGRRRTELGRAVSDVLEAFADRILPYDLAAARVYADLRATRRRDGLPLSVEDGMIAAICRVNSAQLATRNVRDFDGLDVPLIDPWAD